MIQTKLIPTCAVAGELNRGCDNGTRITVNGLKVTKAEAVRLLDRNYEAQTMHGAEMNVQSEPGYPDRYTYFAITSATTGRKQ